MNWKVSFGDKRFRVLIATPDRSLIEIRHDVAAFSERGAMLRGLGAVFYRQKRLLPLMAGEKASAMVERLKQEGWAITAEFERPI